MTETSQGTLWKVTIGDVEWRKINERFDKATIDAVLLDLSNIAAFELTPSWEAEIEVIWNFCRAAARDRLEHDLQTARACY